jgi:hypothetical protein
MGRVGDGSDRLRGQGGLLFVHAPRSQDAQKARRRGLTTITIRTEPHTGHLKLVISSILGMKPGPSLSARGPKVG